MKTAGLLLVMLILGACQSPPANDSAAVSVLLDARYDRFSDAYETKDVDLVAQLYTTDAYYLQPGGDITRGRDAIRASFARFFDGAAARGDTLTIAFTILDRGIADDQAYDIGYYDLRVGRLDGTAGEDRGKFVVIWRLGTDGEWRIHADGYSGVN